MRVGEAISADVRTEPQNPEVDACFAEAITRYLGEAGFEAGAWRLETRAQAELAPWMTEERLAQALESYAGHLATACFEHGAPERVEVHARAVLDADGVDVEVHGGQPAFQRCLADALGERLRQRLSVSRRVDAERFERFFRIDATVTRSYAFEVETPEEREARQRETRERVERERLEWHRLNR